MRKIPPAIIGTAYLLSHLGQVQNLVDRQFPKRSWEVKEMEHGSLPVHFADFIEHQNIRTVFIHGTVNDYLKQQGRHVPFTLPTYAAFESFTGTIYWSTDGSSLGIEQHKGLHEYGHVIVNRLCMLNGKNTPLMELWEGAKEKPWRPGDFHQYFMHNPKEFGAELVARFLHSDYSKSLVFRQYAGAQNLLENVDDIVREGNWKRTMRGAFISDPRISGRTQSSPYHRLF